MILGTDFPHTQDGFLEGCQGYHHQQTTIVIINLYLASIWASLRDNLSLGFPKRSYPNQPAQLQRLPRKKNGNFASIKFDMILSNKHITKALIRLRGCAGWSAPLLFTNHQRPVFLRRGPFIVLKSLSAFYIC